MADTLDLFIDLNDAGWELDPEALEQRSLYLVEELQEDGAVEEARLARAREIPEGSKSGEAGFDLGILKAEVNLENIVRVLDWLKTRMVGATLRIEYGDVKLEYQTSQQLEQQLLALEKISHLTVRVVKCAPDQN